MNLEVGIVLIIDVIINNTNAINPFNISQKHPKWPTFQCFGGTKNGTSGARIKILKKKWNKNHPNEHADKLSP